MKKIFKNSILAIALTAGIFNTVVQGQTIIPNKLKGCAPELGITFDIVPAPSGNNVIDFGGGVVQVLSTYTNISTSYLTPGSQLVQLYTNAGTIANPVAGTLIDSVRILISQKPDVSFTASNVKGCAPLATSFTKTVTTYGSPVITTTWVFGDGDASNSTANTITHPYQVNCPAGATYSPSLTVADANGCQNTFSLALPISVSCKPKIILTPAAPFTSCTTPKAYFFNASSSTSGSPNGSGSNLTIDWKLKENLSGVPAFVKLNSDTVNQTYTTGSYNNYVIVTDDNSCTDSLYFGVSIGNPKINKFNIPDTICANTPINFYDSIKVFNSSSWIMNMGDGHFFSPTPNNKFFEYDTCGVFRIKLTAKNGNGCQDTISKAIVVQKINLSFETVPSYICEMERIKPLDIKIKNTTQFCGGVDATYKWEVFDTNYVKEVAPTHSWYKLNDKINVAEVHYPWHVVGASTGPGPVAPGTVANTPYVTTTNKTADSASFQLQWLDTNQYATHNYMGYQHGTLFGRITLSAVSNRGCKASLTKTFVDTLDIVESFFTMSDHHGCAPLSITFKDSSISSQAAKTGATLNYPINTWSWNFDDGTALDPLQNPTHTFTTPGIYNIKLAVKNTKGCRDTSYAIQVQVGDAPTTDFTVTPPSCHDAVVNFTDLTTFATVDPANTTYSYYASSPNLVQGFPSPTYANGPFNANNQAMSSCFTSPLSTYKFENIAGPITVTMKTCVRGCCDDAAKTINIGGPLVRLRAALLNQGDSTFKCSSTYIKTAEDSTTLAIGDYSSIKFSAHVQDGDKISMDWEGNGTYDSVFTINSASNHFFMYNHHYSTTGTFKAIIKVENTINGCPPSYDTVIVYPNIVKLNAHLRNYKDTIICVTDPGKASAVNFVAHTLGADWRIPVNSLSWDWDDDSVTFVPPYTTNTKADTLPSHGFFSWGYRNVVVTMRDINNCILRDTVHLKINGINPKIVLADRNFVNGQQYMCQFDTMHIKNLSTSSSNITDWYWGVYEEKPVPNTNPIQYTYTAPGAPPVYYPNYTHPYTISSNLNPPPPYPGTVLSPWGQHINNPTDGDLRGDTAVDIIKDSWPKQFPLVIIYQMRNADGCVSTVNNFRWEEVQNAPELGAQPFTTKTFCLFDTLKYRIKLTGSKAEQDTVRAHANLYQFKWVWGDGTKDTTHTFDTIKHRYDYVLQTKYAPDYLKAGYKFQLNVVSPEGCKKIIKIVPYGTPPSDSVFVYRKPDNGIVTTPPSPVNDTAIFCYNSSSLNVLKPEYKWKDKNITYHWTYTVIPNPNGADTVIVPNKKSPGDSILYLPDSLHIGLQHATLYTTIDGVAGCNSDTAILPFKIDGVRGDFSFNKTLICRGEQVQFDTLKVKGAKSWVWVFGDATVQDSGQTAPAKHTYTSATSNGQYVVAIKFYNGNCTETKSKIINVEDVRAKFNRNGEIAPTVGGIDTTHCLNITDNLTNQSTVVPVGATITYAWDFGNGSGSTTTNTSVKYTTPGIYIIRLIANDAVKGCTDTIYKTIKVNPSPVANFTVNDTCFDDVTGKSRPIKLNGSGGGSGATYNWYVYNTSSTLPLDSIKNPVNDSTGVIEIVSPLPEQTFFLAVTNQFGCKDTISKKAQVFTKPLSKTFSDTILIGDTDTLEAALQNPDKYTYVWNPATDLSCANCPTTISSTLEDITYTLNYSDKAGCFTVSNIYNIKVDPLTTMDVPTAFTPNADGTNDIVYVDGRGIKQLNFFKIYNRWGELVFETANIKEGWDGTFKGQKQPIETYVWQAEVKTYAKDETKNTIFKKGVLKLFR